MVLLVKTIISYTPNNAIISCYDILTSLILNKLNADHAVHGCLLCVSCKIVFQNNTLCNSSTYYMSNTDNLYPIDKSTLPTVRFNPSDSCYLPSDNVLRLAAYVMQCRKCVIQSLQYFSPAGFRLSLILPCALSVSHSPIDRSDPSDKVVYGRTIFYRWQHTLNLL